MSAGHLMNTEVILENSDVKYIDKNWNIVREKKTERLLENTDMLLENTGILLQNTEMLKKILKYC